MGTIHLEDTASTIKRLLEFLDLDLESKICNCEIRLRQCAWWNMNEKTELKGRIKGLVQALETVRSVKVPTTAGIAVPDLIDL